MKPFGVAIIGFVWWVTPAAAQSPAMPGQFEDCQTLQACIHALDAIAPSRQNGAGSPRLDSQFAKRLETFGEPAKREVLKRAAGPDKGWRELAGWLLMYWKSFDESDVPPLILALHADPGGGAARPLGRIGTPEAINALVEDVRLHGAENQSGWALSQLGDRVFPYLMPFLWDDKQWHDAASILRDMKSKAVDGLNAWLTTALDMGKPERDRVGALRGIGILGTSVRDVGPKIRPLLSVNDGYGPIPETAKNVLAAMGDEAVASDAILACKSSTDPFEGSFDSTTCLERAAAIGKATLPYANLILTTFTESRTGADRANGASFLGYIGYGAVRQRLLELLRDPDWRVVYAAVRSLSWLGAREAIPELTTLGKTHWLDAVRNEAMATIVGLQSNKSMSRPTARDGTLGYPPEVPLGIDASNAPDVAPCKSGRWNWNGHEFSVADDVSRAVSVRPVNNLPAGVLKGRDSGEFGGEVKWETSSAKPLVLVDGNVEGMEPNGDGAIAVIGSGGVWTDYDPSNGSRSNPSVETVTVENGPGGIGYALTLNRDLSGAWRVRETVRFPRAAFGLKTIGQNLFVAWSGNRAIAFTSSGVHGVAQCDP